MSSGAPNSRLQCPLYVKFWHIPRTFLLTLILRKFLKQTRGTDAMLVQSPMADSERGTDPPFFSKLHCLNFDQNFQNISAIDTLNLLG